MDNTTKNLEVIRLMIDQMEYFLLFHTTMIAAIILAVIHYKVQGIILAVMSILPFTGYLIAKHVMKKKMDSTKNFANRK